MLVKLFNNRSEESLLTNRIFNKVNANKIDTPASLTRSFRSKSLFLLTFNILIRVKDFNAYSISFSFKVEKSEKG